MGDIAVGLPNTGLKPLTPTFTTDVKQTIPFERQGSDTGITAETDLIAAETIASNKKVSIRDIFVQATQADAIFRVYRGTVAIATYHNVALGQTEKIPLEEGLEYDENETFRVTAELGTSGDATVEVVGREELKRNELFSQVLA